MSDAIAGAQAGLRVLTDGTVRITIDVEPKDRVAAMTLFGAPGQPIALVALKDGHAQAGVKPAESSYRELGPICREAIDLCSNPRFHDYIEQLHNMDSQPTEKTARDFICSYCHVASRKELDAAEGARELFIEHVRKPFLQWLRKQPA